MRLILKLLSLTLALLAIASLPARSHAAELSLTSSTQYLWYQDLLADKKQNDVAQYLRVNVTKLDKEGKANIYAYGRASQQVTSDEGLEGRLYYLYFSYQDALNNHLDLRAGRTYVHSAAVAGTIDGGYLEVKNLGPLGITGFGGREVLFQDKAEVGGGNAMSGASVYLNAPKTTHVEVSYGNKYRSSDLARENVGLDYTTTPVEMLNTYGRVKYDTIGDKFNELLFGIKLAPLKDLLLKGEFVETRPTFDNNSIYTFFNVDRYREINGSLEYAITSAYKFNLKYAKEYFGEDADANVYDIGLWARPITDLTFNGSYEKRNGFAGQLSGFRFDAGYDIAKAKIQAGIDYDDFTRDDSRAGTAKKYWAGAGYQFNKLIGLTARVEWDVNYRDSDACQGFAAVNVNY
jgi:hypothetical protein